MTDTKTLAKELNIPRDKLLQRIDGRIEWICKHGIGHTIFAPKTQGKWGYVHGCDGCCKEIKKKVKEDEK